MKLYKVKALSVGAKGNKIFNSGDTVKETNFAPGRADELVKLGFLEDLGEDESSPAMPAVAVSLADKTAAEIYAEEMQAKGELFENAILEKLASDPSNENYVALNKALEENDFYAAYNALQSLDEDQQKALPYFDEILSFIKLAAEKEAEAKKEAAEGGSSDEDTTGSELWQKRKKLMIDEITKKQLMIELTEHEIPFNANDNKMLLFSLFQKAE
jgi:hypothetical protein